MTSAIEHLKNTKMKYSDRFVLIVHPDDEEAAKQVYGDSVDIVAATKPPFTCKNFPFCKCEDPGECEYEASLERNR